MGYKATAKVVFLLVIAVGLFYISDWRWFAGLFVVQLVMWLHAGLGVKPVLRVLKRLRWFILLILVSYLLLPPANNTPDYQLDLGFFTLDFYLSGLEHAALMLSRVLLLVFNSVWVRMSESPGVFVRVLGQFGLPQSISIIIDSGLVLASGDQQGKGGDGSGKGTGKGGGAGSGKGGGSGQGGGKGNKSKGRIEKSVVFFRDLRQGNLRFLDDLIGKALKKSTEFLKQHYPDLSETMLKDAAIVLCVVVAIMSLKLLQLLPGLPFAPGHKNLLVIPLLLLASMSTSGKFGGFVAGFSVGVVSFLMGYGKFGILEIFQFALPGLLADFMLPLLMKGKGIWLLVKLAFIGAMLGLTRFAANFLVLMLAGSPDLAWLVFAPMLASQVIFGSLSCLVCIYLVNKYRDNNIYNHHFSTEET